MSAIKPLGIQSPRRFGPPLSPWQGRSRCANGGLIAPCSPGDANGEKPVGSKRWAPSYRN